MIGFVVSVLGILAATLVPVYVSLYLVSNLKFIHVRYVAMAAVGLAFWFFFDTMGDAAQLDVNQAFTGGVTHVAIVVVFLAGIAAIALFDHFAVAESSRSRHTQTDKEAIARQGYLFLIPAGIAAIMGIHGLGEGWNFASVASSTASQSLADAFGGLGALASYPLHKFLEATIIAAAYSAYVGRSNLSIRASWQLPVLGLLFGLPSAIGASIGYYVPTDTTYFFAFGVTASMYAIIRLIEPINPNFRVGENAPSPLGWKVFLALIIGFFLLYSAALLH